MARKYTSQKVSRKSFTGSHLFVSQDPSSLNNGKQLHSTIKSHIQREYNPWRRRQRFRFRVVFPKQITNTEQESNSSTEPVPTANFPALERYTRPTRPSVLKVGAPRPKHRNHVFHEHSTVLRTTPSTTRPTSLDDVGCLEPPLDLARVDPNEQIDHDSVSHIAGFAHHDIAPATILNAGNSDSFSCFPVDVGPFVNKVMSFYRDVALAGLYQTPQSRWSPQSSPMRAWRNCVRIMAMGEGVSYSFLGRYAQMIYNVTRHPEHGRQALHYRSCGTKALRLRISDVAQIDTYETFWHIGMLHGLEVVSHNVAAALAHGKMLRILLEKEALQRPLDLDLVRYIILADMRLSCRYLVRPILDYTVWVPLTLLPQWETEETIILKTTEATPSPVSDSILDTRLEILLLSQRETSRWFQDTVTAKPNALSALALWHSARNHIHQAQLIDYYLDTMEYTPHLSACASHEACHNAYVALAALYEARSGLGEILVNNAVNTYEVHQAVLENLKVALATADRKTSGCPHCQARFAPSRLWALFVGALGEVSSTSENSFGRRSPSFPSSGSSNDCINIVDDWRPSPQLYFKPHFARQAVAMGLLTWHSTRKILMQFIVSEVELKLGGDWFWTAVQPILSGPLTGDQEMTASS